MSATKASEQGRERGARTREGKRWRGREREKKRQKSTKRSQVNKCLTDHHDKGSATSRQILKFRVSEQNLWVRCRCENTRKCKAVMLEALRSSRNITLHTLACYLMLRIDTGGLISSRDSLKSCNRSPKWLKIQIPPTLDGFSPRNINEM